jgi:predicted RNA-binding Zn-ribbon protein involved in translation (DUF1610 family)
MPHITCESCKASLYSAARSASLTDSSCPSCGASFEAQSDVARGDDGGGVAAAVPATLRLELQP